MTITEPARDAGQRKRDVLERLEREEDIWVASADGDGVPFLVPLWFRWDGEAVWLATRLTSRTARNLRATGRARLAFPATRDVVLVDGEAEVFTAEDVPAAAADGFAERYGWEPRGDHASYGYLRVLPRTVQAWRGEYEMPGRHVMREGRWTA
ncbi:pyridoxamine 5'-phosphate oxidase family protein [Streptomyces sp. NPDC048172]|uniref:pyridoxamine 5'-phosphate oxidase family protein n=1 Tax=Streptomyces sp. NPDC048172 TaxID=3365505 RepID=UPI00371E163B